MYLGGLALRQGIGLRDFVGGADGHRDGAVRDGCSRHAHSAVDDHGTGARVDHHTRGRLAGLDVDVLEHAHEGHALVQIHGRAHRDGHTVQGLGHIAAKFGVDGVHDRRAGREVVVTQIEHDLLGFVEGVVDQALHNGATWNACRGGHANGHLGTRRLGINAGGGQVALGQCINLAVHPTQGGQHQVAAPEVAGLADGRHVDVHPLPGLGKARQFGGHHHRGGVLDVDPAGGGDLFKVRQRAVDAYPQLRQQGLHALGSERHRGVVARALQTHHQTKTDQHVGALGGHRGQVLDTVGHGSLACETQRRQQAPANHAKQMRHRHQSVHRLLQRQKGQNLCNRLVPQPTLVALARSPVPRYAICALARRSDCTVPLGPTSCGRMTPAT